MKVIEKFRDLQNIQHFYASFSHCFILSTESQNFVFCIFLYVRFIYSGLNFKAPSLTHSFNDLYKRMLYTHFWGINQLISFQRS